MIRPWNVGVENLSFEILGVSGACFWVSLGSQEISEGALRRKQKNRFPRDLQKRNEKP